MATRLTRTQALVLVSLAASWLALVAILALTPDFYDRTLRAAGGEVGPARAAFLAAVSAFLALLALGVVRRWRWTFWLIAVAFLAGALRVVASLLQIVGVLPASDPGWYLALQAAIGLVQVPIGALMLVGRRRGGTWSSF